MWGEMVGPAQRASLVKSAEQGKEDQAPNICFAVSPRIEGSDQWMGTWALRQANYGKWTQECDCGLADVRAVLVFVLQSVTIGVQYMSLSQTIGIISLCHKVEPLRISFSLK